MDQPVSPPTPLVRSGVARIIQEDLQHLKASWFGFLLFGLLLIILGGIALSYSVLATALTVIIVGYFLLVSGVFYIAGSFFTGAWGGFFLSLLAGVLHLVAGFFLLNHPAEAAIVYTLLLAVIFFVEGIFRIFSALVGQFRHWGLVLCSGVITLLLGISIWRQWPFDGLYVIGLFVGINLIVQGATFVSLSLAARKISA